ncbi:ras-related protein rab-2a [Anaeramoeba ignava]|uniref:Ras-related protein rab-2a n=1 Tax=Anaeramoeba ignava TaxID=1746090 RepID=A0A9Q0R7P4_ANAIG|nr:ras-related protein rab-2a [Anaeramoeba ignava]
MTYEYMFKFIVVGNSGVGKSSLLSRFTEQKFKISHEPTIGVEIGARTITIDGHLIKIQVWDTVGQESFHSLTRSYYRAAAGALLVYDVTRRDTFDSISKWLQNAEQEVANLQSILIGNKVDLSDRIQVQTEEGKKFADQHGLLFKETSAKDNLCIDEAFNEVAERIYQKIISGEINIENNLSGIKKPPKENLTEENISNHKKRKCC